MSIRPKIEAALAATAERLSPGSGESAVHHAKNDLMTIGASSENLDGRYADDEVRIASFAVFEAKHPDGDPVTFKKAHDGLIAVFSDSFVFVRGMGFGAREVKALRTGDVDVEKVTAVVDGVEVPGLRIAGPAGHPRFTLAIAVPRADSDPAEATAVRDEIHALLAG